MAAAHDFALEFLLAEDDGEQGLVAAVVHEVGAVATVVEVHVSLSLLGFLCGSLEQSAQVPFGSHNEARVQPALTQAIPQIPAKTGVGVVAVGVLGEWRFGNRIAADRLDLVGSTSFARTEDDCLLQTLSIDRGAQSLS